MGKGKTGSSHKSQSKKQTGSDRANIVFPVGRVHRILKKQYCRGERVSKGAGVFLAAVLEYLTVEVIELAANKVVTERRHRVKPRDIMEACQKDEELDQLLNNVEFRDAGYIADQQPILAKKRSTWRATDTVKI